MYQNIDNAIRRHADGSIDTDFYLARCHLERSRQFYDLIGALGRLVHRLRARAEAGRQAVGVADGPRAS
jgi:hypothetical protein